MGDMLKVKSNLANYPPPAQHIQIQIHPSLSLSLKPAVSGLTAGGCWWGVLSYLKLKALVSITNSPERVLKLQPEHFRESSDNRDTPTALPYNLTGVGKTFGPPEISFSHSYHICVLFVNLF